MKAWNKYTDNELDDFFKEEVLNRSTGSAEKNWDKLSASLKEEGLSKPHNPWKKYLALLGVVLFFFTATYFIVSSTIDTSTFETVLNTGLEENNGNNNLSSGGDPKGDITNTPKSEALESTQQATIASNQENKNFTSSSQKQQKGQLTKEGQNSLNASIPVVNNSEIEEKESVKLTRESRKNGSPKTENTSSKNVNSTTVANNSSEVEKSQGLAFQKNENNKLNDNSKESDLSLGLAPDITEGNKENRSLNNIVTESESNIQDQVEGSGLITSPEKVVKAFTTLNISELDNKSITPNFIDDSDLLNYPFILKGVTSTAIVSKPRFNKNLYLNLSYSPDFSAVVKNSFFKMGHNISAQLEYQFSPRWSVLSGVIESKKHYNAGNDQMSWPSNWGNMPKELEGMEGNCNVLDIPLNFRYNIKGDDKATMFIVGGISNFILLKEQYDYIYPEYVNTDGMKTKWEGKTGFLFAGMANLSLGYERKLTSNISLQVEPFVKAPLRDFGFTSVKLISTGVFVTAKVKLN